jgi:hypothetical protein
VLQLKDLWGRSVGEKVAAWDGKILKELEGFARALLSDKVGICDGQGCGARRKEVKREALWVSESGG